VLALLRPLPVPPAPDALCSRPEGTHSDQRASPTRHRFGFFLTAGVLITIAMQALMNVFVAVRWAPVKGIPLPFVSSGGSSLAVLCLGVGLVLSVARHSDLESPELGVDGGPAGATA
jgi:hypothetical protein